MEQLQTHNYDGKLHERKQLYINEINRVRTLDKRREFEELKNLLQLPPQQQMLFDAITQSNVGNYDPTNDMDAKDLIFLCFEKRQEEAMVPLLRLAFEDMLTGSCPQGRSTRMFQVLVSLEK
jgi:hypothetical protein